MQNEADETPRYTAFLFTGAHPAWRPRQWSEVVVGAAGLAFLAFVTGGAGYLMTERLLPQDVAISDGTPASDLKGASFARAVQAPAANQERSELDTMISERLRMMLRTANPAGVQPHHEHSGDRIND